MRERGAPLPGMIVAIEEMVPSEEKNKKWTKRKKNKRRGKEKKRKGREK